MAPNRGKDLPPKYNSVALYGAEFPFLLFFAFLVFLIYWHLAFFLPGYFPFGAQTKLALTEPRQTFQNVAEGGGARMGNRGRERACTREGEDGEEGVVVVVDRNDDEKQRRRTQSDQQLLTQKHTNSTTQITE